jgi:NAD(P)-dependent dehydrogenase (short-subunit alcohol dehydrogenase family)
MKATPFDLSGNVVVVTGGGGLIGEAVCETLDKCGARVVVADNSEESGNAVANRLDRGEFKELDITSEDSVVELCDYVIGQYGGIDGLVNAAYPRNENYGQPFESVGLDDWAENVTLHLGGYYNVTREVALHMVDSGNGGAIVNFGSIYGIQAPDFSVYNGVEFTSPIEYSAIKAGILNFSRYLASYLGEDDVRVNVVSPGGVFDDQEERFVENYEQRVPLGRMATPEDITGAVVYLLSDAASYVTGHNLVVDGGWTIK